MIFYIQATETGRITDAISYPYEDYVATEVTLPLPVGLLGGAYELRGGQILYRPEWDKDEMIEAIKSKNEALQMAIAELSIMMGGV